MMKLQGIVSEIAIILPLVQVTAQPVVEEKEEKEIEVFRPEETKDNVVYIPRNANIPTVPELPEEERRMNKLLLGSLIAIFFVFIITLGIIKLLDNSDAVVEEKIQWAKVQVQSGDTMWALVTEHVSNKNADARELVSLLKHRNQLATADLQIGMVIEVPIVQEIK